MKTIFLSAILATSVASIGAAHANCRIHNDTKWSFTIESGNTSNQRVGAHTTTSIADGRIIGKSDTDSVTISGSCKNGEEVEVKEDRGVPVLTVKK